VTNYDSCYDFQLTTHFIHGEVYGVTYSVGMYIIMSQRVLNFVFLISAAIGEISGCYAFWAWLRLGKSILWTIPGIIALVGFASVLTKVDMDYAGRVYAIYGGIYILSSLIWFWSVEGGRPDKWDLIGVSISLLGTSIIMFGKH
jgi:small multidrug resistance family-3 protein